MQPSTNSSSVPRYNLHQLQGNKAHGSEKVGYLLKKSESKLRRNWQRRRCIIKDSLLYISHHDVSYILKTLSAIIGAGRVRSEVERSLMVRWVVGLILHGVDPLSYFSFQPVLHDWCNKGRGMCYPVCGMVHIKEPLLLIDKSSLCGDSGFPFSLSEWSLTICLTPYNHR